MMWEVEGARHFSVVIHVEEDAAFVDVAGELDIYTGSRLEDKLSWVRGACTSVVLDLSGVTFIDVSGLDPIQEAVESDPTVVIGATSPAFRHLLELIDLESLLG